MNFTIQTSSATETATPCLVLPIWQDQPLSDAAQQWNERLNGLIQSVLDEDDFKAAIGATRVLYVTGDSASTCSRVLLLGLGKCAEFSPWKWRQATARAARAVRGIKRSEFALALPQCDNDCQSSPLETGQGAVEGVLLGLHQYNSFKTDDETKNQTKIENVTLLAPEGADEEAMQNGIERGQIIGAANLSARGWVNAPSNTKSPAFLAHEAQRIADENGLKCEVWDENKIQQEKMGALYAVGMGSDNPPRFIILEHAPAGTENDAPIVLVGKGITFDSGGYSIKPGSGMEEMKDDMAGAAVVLGSMQAVGQLKPQQRIIGIVSSAENMINGRAQRPGDIVTARNGLTIEVLNTDAEGRLVLADALSYASELKPRMMLDFATLTGAIGIALGQHAAGLFCNDDELAAQLSEAGDRSGDRVWRLPIWEEYRDSMKGNISDLKNITGDRYAGSITAAIFLEKFVGDDIPWAHLDIATIAAVKEDRPLSQRGATGFGVRLVIDWLEQLAAN